MDKPRRRGSAPIKKKIAAVDTAITMKNVDVATRFEYIKKLGEGGYAEVWKVRDRNTGEILALKSIFKHKITPKVIDETIREVVILREFYRENGGCNPHIACYRDVFNCGDRVCVLLDFVEGREATELLGELMDLNEILPPKQLKSFMRQTLEGLAAIHSQGIAHRDIKLENIIFKDDGTIVLIDFGFACNIRGISPSKFGCTGTPGTEELKAPEIFDNSILKDPRGWLEADIWALGITFMEMAEGEQSEEGWGKRIADGEIDTVPQVDYEDRVLGDIINDMLSINPKDRPTARNLLDRVNAHRI